MIKFLRTFYLFIRTVILKIIGLFIKSPSCSIDTNKIRKILFIRVDRIGDLVLSTPALKFLKQKYPRALLAVLVSPSVQTLIEACPFIDEVLAFDEKMNLRREGFDLVIDGMDDYTLKSAILAYQTKAKYRVGYDHHGRGVFFTHSLPAGEYYKPFIDRMIDLTKESDEGVDDRCPELHVPSKAQENVLKYFNDNEIGSNDIVITIHPGGFYWTQRWVPQRFAAVADLIVQRYGAKIILMESQREIALINEIRSSMNSKPFVFIGRPIEECIALIKRSQLMICSNSGPMHIATAVETPTVSLIGPQNPDRWWPYGKGHIVLRKQIPCIGCGSGRCRIKSHDCMELITVEEVMKAIDTQFVTFQKVV